jgi:phospholipase C
MISGTPIERIAVLMMENRSFDHLLGHLDHGGLQPLGPDDRNLRDLSDPDDGWCPSFYWPSDKDVEIDPGHGHDDVTRQLRCVFVVK